MPVTSFYLIDRANQKNKVTVEEDKTIGQIMDQFFVDKHYTMQMITKSSVITINRSEIIKNVFKKGIKEKGDVKYKLIHTREFIDVYINKFTQSILNIYDDKRRIYCTDDTTVIDIENDLNDLFHKENELGLYGYCEDDSENVFKLKGDDHVLFIKRCFLNVNFFQCQFNNNIEAIKNLEVIFESKFYRLDYPEQKIIFKTAHRYNLRGTTLIKMKHGNIADCFYDINEASVSIQKYFGKNILIIKNTSITWLLCTFSDNVCFEMYQALLSCKSNNIMRKVDKIAKTKQIRKSIRSNIKEPEYIDSVDRMIECFKINDANKNRKLSHVTRLQTSQEKQDVDHIDKRARNKNDNVSNKRDKKNKTTGTNNTDIKDSSMKRPEITLKTNRSMNFFQKIFSPSKPKQ